MPYYGRNLPDDVTDAMIDRHYGDDLPRCPLCDSALDEYSRCTDEGESGCEYAAPYANVDEDTLRREER